MRSGKLGLKTGNPSGQMVWQGSDVLDGDCVVGDTVGDRDGVELGESVGDFVGGVLGDEDGTELGETVGDCVGAVVGLSVVGPVGECVG
mmetsp:Transcript_24948/g.51844  ORF Transcript_24948/g.51844 Transcript_24948/m.51844 type:complete len:89 (-) Transcript_24948:1258-1524(-)